MQNPAKIGLLGAGNISRSMVKTLRGMPNATCHAVAARELSRAQSFAAEWDIPVAYGSYEAMLEDPSIDLVYIATPHSHHARQAKLCIEYGKPVLCEKAFTANAAQAAEVLELAHKKGVFITEAIWPRYMPLAKQMRSLIDDGSIGNAHILTASLGDALTHIERMVKPELAGGALLDLGIYPLTFAMLAFGSEITRFSIDGVLSPAGVDLQNSITLHYADGRMAVLYSTMLARTGGDGLVMGDAGALRVDRISSFGNLTVLDKALTPVETFAREAGTTGYEYEVQASLDAIAAGHLECPDMPHEETLRVMRLMDEMRERLGVRYPFEA